MTKESHSGYTGAHYLLDLHDEREFAVHFKDGTPLAPVNVFNGTFKPSETIAAIADEIYITRKKNNRSYAEAILFEMTTDAEGKVRRGKYLAGVFEVQSKKTKRDLSVVFKATARTKRELAEKGFNHGSTIHLKCKDPVAFTARIQSEARRA